jgi:hypothetical protein
MDPVLYIIWIIFLVYVLKKGTNFVNRKDKEPVLESILFIGYTIILIVIN